MIDLNLIRLVVTSIATGVFLFGTLYPIIFTVLPYRKLGYRDALVLWARVFFRFSLFLVGVGNVLYAGRYYWWPDMSRDPLFIYSIVVFGVLAVSCVILWSLNPRGFRGL